MTARIGIVVYNTCGRRMEEFVPIRPPEVGMYVCGPTVYDDCHLGHARAMVAFDVIVRWLEYRGYRVKYVRNITDVDDKIIKRAAERGVSCAELAAHFIEGFHRDMQLLGMREPDVEPKATDHIQEMIDLISKLWDKGLLYRSEGDVYFDVGAFPNYGKLSGRKTEDLLAGARVEVNARKRNPFDFVLWKAAKEGELQWPSPWGPGRPGWHIECSAMSAKYLGNPFDIHGGGEDLIFPHHENEVAQSEGAMGTPPARYWLHNAFVTIDKAKMSKSLGNFFTLRQVFQKHDPRVVRFFLLRTHYRTPVDFSEEALIESNAALKRIEECINRVAIATEGKINSAESCPLEFANAMDKDFNTTEALGVIFGLVSKINIEFDRKSTGWREKAAKLMGEVLKCCEVLGIKPILTEVMTCVLKVPVVMEVDMQARKVKDITDLEREEIRSLLSENKLSMEQIRKLLGFRNIVRVRKEYQLADQIRARIEELGYNVRDDKGTGSTAQQK